MKEKGSLFRRYISNRYVWLFFIIYFEIYFMYGYIPTLLALGMVFACICDLWRTKHERK